MSENQPLKDPLPENVKWIFDEYKLVLETQMHFNEMLLRYRSLAFTVIPAFGGLAAFILGNVINAKVGLLFGSTLLGVWIAVFLVDYLYYFRMLLGAVRRSKEMEDEIRTQGFSPSFLGLTTHICKRVPEWLAHLLVILFYFIPGAIGVIIIFILKS